MIGVRIVLLLPELSPVVSFAYLEGNASDVLG
jgi:hypothetical protein